MRTHLTRTLASTTAAVLAVVLGAALAFAQTANPRIGTWKLKQDAPPPALNIMTYEPLGPGGMKVTVESTNRSGQLTKWTYNTMLDGQDEPVTGSPSTDTTAVKKIDDRTNEITNKKGGRVTQVIINVLTADGKTINNTYKNYNAQGEQTTTTTAVYEKQ
jgi:hypothetical protein